MTKNFGSIIYFKICILLFRSGKAVATGAKTTGDMDIAFEILQKDLRKNDFDIYDDKDLHTVFHNVVITTDFSSNLGGKRLNLSKVVLHLPFPNTEYEPEQFPGLIYKNPEDGVVYLFFSSGRCVITGAKSFEGALEAKAYLQDELSIFFEGGDPDDLYKF